MSNTKIFIINGRGGTGKDTFIEMCGEFCRTKSYSSVTKVKEAAKVLGWIGEKGMSDRKFLSELKDLSTKYNDGPFRSMQEEYRKYQQGEKNADALFFHVREPKEIERCKKEFNAQTILMVSNKTANTNYGNHADDDVDHYVYDIVIANDGTLQDLRESAWSFVHEYVKEQF